MKFDEQFWTEKYRLGKTGWDIGYVSTPIKEYIDQLTDKDLDILIPGGGNSYEAEYLFKNGFRNGYVLDISEVPLNNLRNRIPEFPANRTIHSDFFELDKQFDRVLEQTFFCALPPTKRPDYVRKMHEILKPGGKLAGLLFDMKLNDDHPPFGGSESEYRKLFEPYFDILIMETATNSIPPRAGNEFFILMQKKS